MSDLSWWPAPAKLNLFLHVVRRRPDGYHDLQTLFQLIDRCDRIGIAVRNDGQVIRHGGLPEVTPDQDLTVRAARALQERCGTPFGADLHVVKHIPVGGGLGGGSTDAATVLLALDRLWGCGLDLGELADIGLELGADVPVFVRGRTAWGEGRGEILEPVERPERWFLVIHPGVAVSTAEMFQAPELTRNSPVITIRAFSEGGTGNAFEPIVRARYAEVASALDWLNAQIDARNVVIPARLTGTGACIFASFERAEDAERIAARVPDRWSAFVARGLGCSPIHDRLK
ncbi:MAG TPA: 4-(cytidine 5'-diphospho)-2-C-methyl-D-erythritol kinase [Steroidobacteraceae bacterium]|nr:4-(cytidine 5'-diphospho)-2-C-methyl-D-erythritol kinase [Steroidobacteraceae bacterium]